MVHHMDDLGRAIGRRVRLGRQQRGWTLDQLAAAAGVSRRVVVNIEQGAANPNITTLLGISGALGIGLPDLVAQDDRPDVHVTPRGSGAVLWSGPRGGRAELVAGSSAPEVVELWDWTLAAGERHDSTPHAPGTLELLHVHRGSLVLHVGDERRDLSHGDAATFPGDIAHAYVNGGATDASFSLAVFEPGVGGAARPAAAGERTTTGQSRVEPGEGGHRHDQH